MARGDQLSPNEIGPICASCLQTISAGVHLDAEKVVPVMALVWLAVVAGLVLFELHHLAFFALFGAAGAAAAGGVATVAPNAYAGQIGAAVVVTVAGIGVVRPYVSDVYERRHHAQHVARGVHGGLIGHEAVTLDHVGGVGERGHVRFVGERWLARGVGDEPIGVGERVLIVAVEGTTLLVAPVSNS
jgi:membrane protein implicated in regulation of membrane protease activity